MHIKNSVLLTFLTVFATQCHDVTDEEFATQCKVKEELSNKEIEKPIVLTNLEIERSISNAAAFCFDYTFLQEFFKKEAFKNGGRVFEESKINTIKACINKQFNEKNQNRKLNENQNKFKQNCIDLQTGNSDNKTYFHNNMEILRESNSKSTSNIDFYTKTQTWKNGFNEGREKYKNTWWLLRWWHLKLKDKIPYLGIDTIFEDIGYRYEYDQANKNE